MLFCEGNKSPPFSITCVVAVPIEPPLSLVEEESSSFSTVPEPNKTVNSITGTIITKKKSIMPIIIPSFILSGIIAVINELTPFLFSLSIYLPPPTRKGNSQSKAFTLIN